MTAISDTGAKVPQVQEPNPPLTLASVIIERIRAGTTLEETKEYYAFLRQIQADEAKTAFAADFVQLNLPAIPKRGKIEMQGRPPRTYTRLEDILEIIEPILQQHGFRVRFDVPQEAPDYIRVEAILEHRGGYSKKAGRTLPLDKGTRMNIVQAYGSTQTYAQRYAIILLLALKNCDEDDDATAVGNGKRENPINPGNAKEWEMGDLHVPAPNDPDRVKPPNPIPALLDAGKQRAHGNKIRDEFNAFTRLADLENWKTLESTSYRIWQIREEWRETLQSEIKGKTMELRGAAEQAAFEHEQDAQELAKYEGYNEA